MGDVFGDNKQAILGHWARVDVEESGWKISFLCSRCSVLNHFFFSAV